MCCRLRVLLDITLLSRNVEDKVFKHLGISSIDCILFDFSLFFIRFFPESSPASHPRWPQRLTGHSFISWAKGWLDGRENITWYWNYLLHFIYIIIFHIYLYVIKWAVVLRDDEDNSRLLRGYIREMLFFQWNFHNWFIALAINNCWGWMSTVYICHTCPRISLRI